MEIIRRCLPLTLALVLASACSTPGSDGNNTATSDRDTIAPATSAVTPGTSAATEASSDWTVTPLGIGPVRVGMSVAEVEAVIQNGVTKPAELEPCGYIKPNGGPAGLNFMVRDGRIARVDITDSIFGTVAGARIGDSEDHIKQLYPGQVSISPHKYVDGHYLIVTPSAPADSAYRLVFETDGKLVTRFRSGKMPEVTWVEGCS